MTVRKSISKVERKISSGLVQGNIWDNEISVGDRTTKYKTMSLEKKYANGIGLWKSTFCLNERDIPNAILTLNQAYRYMTLIA